jgi:Protein of unknown function (DUF3040)
MPLSDEEMRMLQQMEQALVNDDPKLVSALRGTEMIRQPQPKKAAMYGIGVLVGLAVLLFGASVAITAVGVAGFVVALTSAAMAVTALRGKEMSLDTVTETPSRAPRTRGGLVSRMEQRWMRRSPDAM